MLTRGMSWARGRPSPRAPPARWRGVVAPIQSIKQARGKRKMAVKGCFNERRTQIRIVDIHTKNMHLGLLWRQPKVALQLQPVLLLSLGMCVYVCSFTDQLLPTNRKRARQQTHANTYIRPANQSARSSISLPINQSKRPASYLERRIAIRGGEEGGQRARVPFPPHALQVAQLCCVQ